MVHSFQTAAVALALFEKAQTGLAAKATIEGYEFMGQGCCASSTGRHYGYVTSNGLDTTVQACAEDCMASFSSDKTFVGINYHPDWFGSPNCNCMFDTRGKGAIAGADIVGCPDELCFSVSSGESKPPSHAEIDGYEFMGKGCCSSNPDEGFMSHFGFVRLGRWGDSITLEECAEGCAAGYSSDEAFVGINYHPDWFGSPNCNCMMDWSGTDREITGADASWCPSELCYRVAAAVMTKSS